MKRRYQTRICQCGQEFKAGRKDTISCLKCRYLEKLAYQKVRSSKDRQAAKKPKACQQCGQEFMPKYVSRQFCSDDCRQAHEKKRVAQYLADIAAGKRYKGQSRRSSVVTDEQLTLPSLAEQERKRMIREARERGEKLPIRELDRLTGLVWK